MLLALLLILIVLWLLGYIPISIFTVPNLGLFSVNGHIITFWNLITLAIILALVGILPRPFREIVGVILILWILSLLGIFLLSGWSNTLIVLLIIGIGVLIFTGTV